MIPQTQNCYHKAVLNAALETQPRIPGPTSQQERRLSGLFPISLTDCTGAENNYVLSSFVMDSLF